MIDTPAPPEMARLTPELTTLARIVKEGYGSAAWHGPDLRTALLGTVPEHAFWRPAPGRHNVAEVALHHAWYVRSVIEQLSGEPGDAFPLPGSDWFEISSEESIAWAAILELVERLHVRLSTLLDDFGAGRSHSPLPASEQLNLVLGITGHAIYHAGQVQLLKALMQTDAWNPPSISYKATTGA